MCAIVTKTFTAVCRCITYLTALLGFFATNMALKRALLILAEGAEEMEAVIVVDVLRRAGVHVDVAGLTGKQAIKCSRGVLVQPDNSLSEAKNEPTYDAVVLPGGLQGAKNLSESEDVKTLLNEQYNAGRIVAAICAAPTVLRAAGVGLGKTITSYPSVKDQLEGYTYSEDRVVVDGNLITSRAPGTAFEFALKLVEQLCGADKVEPLSSAMLLK